MTHEISSADLCVFDFRDSTYKGNENKSLLILPPNVRIDYLNVVAAELKLFGVVCFKRLPDLITFWFLTNLPRYTLKFSFR